jgi:hypothetical protein
MQYKTSKSENHMQNGDAIQKLKNVCGVNGKRQCKIKLFKKENHMQNGDVTR